MTPTYNGALHIADSGISRYFPDIRLHARRLLAHTREFAMGQTVSALCARLRTAVRLNISDSLIEEAYGTTLEMSSIGFIMEIKAWSRNQVYRTGPSISGFGFQVVFGIFCVAQNYGVEKSMATTLKDIARDLGVSVITVSKVLRDHPDISEGTRKRVLKRVKEPDYQPNYAARALITGRTYTIGLVVPDLLHPFFASVAQAISKEIQIKGYSLLISSSDEEPELEQKEIHHLLARRVDVMIVASVQHTVQHLRSLATQKIPYILLDRNFSGLASNFVGVDDRAVGYLATSHLIEQGCERIAHIQGPEVSTAAGRLEGYRNALAIHQMAPVAGHVVPIGTSGDYRGEEAGFDAAQSLLSHRKRPDGIFCFNDPVALGVMRAILEAGLRIPDDIAVVGCGNLSYSDFLRVPLSSVDQGSARIGRAAAVMALKLAQGRGHRTAKTELIEPHIVARASSLRRPPHAPCEMNR